MLIVIQIIQFVSNILSLLIIAQVLLSWFPHNRDKPGIRMLYRLTDPLTRPFRFIPSIGGIDFSPLAALLSIQLLEELLVFSLQKLL